MILPQSSVRRVNLAQLYWQILRALTPCVCAIAIGIRSKRRGSLACAHKIPIAFAFANKLKMTLIDDIVDSSGTVVGKSCTMMHKVKILLRL